MNRRLPCLALPAPIFAGNLTDPMTNPDCAFMPHVLKAKEQGTDGTGSGAGAARCGASALEAQVYPPAP
jgi:hypothetical protein